MRSRLCVAGRGCWGQHVHGAAVGGRLMVLVNGGRYVVFEGGRLRRIADREAGS